MDLHHWFIFAFRWRSAVLQIIDLLAIPSRSENLPPLKLICFVSILNGFSELPCGPSGWESSSTTFFSFGFIPAWQVNGSDWEFKTDAAFQLELTSLFFPIIKQPERLFTVILAEKSVKLFSFFFLLWNPFWVKSWVSFFFFTAKCFLYYHLAGKEKWETPRYTERDRDVSVCNVVGAGGERGKGLEGWVHKCVWTGCCSLLLSYVCIHPKTHT